MSKYIDSSSLNVFDTIFRSAVIQPKLGLELFDALRSKITCDPIALDAIHDALVEFERYQDDYKNNSKNSQIQIVFNDHVNRAFDDKSINPKLSKSIKSLSKWSSNSVIDTNLNSRNKAFEKRSAKELHSKAPRA